MEKIRNVLFMLPFLTGILYAGHPVYFGPANGADITIGTYRVIHSTSLGEDRTLLVHLPRNYNGNDNRYPVVYMLYGNHVTTYFAEAVSVLDNLGPTGRIPDCLLVGIMNTDRYRDLLPETPEGKATGIGNFTRFITEELFPFIENNYRTKDFRILIGPQAGANFALYTLFTQPDLFDALIVNHPFRWRGGRDLIMEAAGDFFRQGSRSKRFVFVTYDDSDPLAKEGIPYLDKLAKMVQGSRSTGVQLELNFVPDNDEFLQPLGMRKGMKTLFARYPFPDDRPVQDLDDILAFYRELSGKYGFEVDPPEHVLTVQADKAMEQGKTSDVLEIIRFTMERYPSAANSYFQMARILFQEGKLEEGREYLQKTVDRVPRDSGGLRRWLAGVDKRIAGSAAYQVEKAIRLTGLAAGIQKFHELRNPSSSFYFEEGEFNQLGYRLMQTGKTNEALEIFKLNVALYPESANAYDSLGEAYMKKGEKRKAIISYKKSLELNPNHKNAGEMLKKLGEEAPDSGITE